MVTKMSVKCPTGKCEITDEQARHWAASIMAKIKSEKRSEAARKNGAKGGRPKTKK